jgi:hypothetical protein
MHSKNIFIIFNIVAFFGVGGWGFLMFRYPRFFANFNARFGFKMFSSPRYITFLRRFGIVEMIVAGVSGVSFLVSLIFGLNWY